MILVKDSNFYYIFELLEIEHMHMLQGFWKTPVHFSFLDKLKRKSYILTLKGLSAW